MRWHMSSHWWRAYDAAIDHAKLLLLTDRQHRAWFNLMCLASANDGHLPEMKVLALKLRMSPAKVATVLAELKAAVLFDDVDGKIVPHNWNSRQYKTDVTDPTNAERQQRYRDRHRVTDNTVTPPVTEGVTAKLPETEADTERKKDDAPSGATPKWAFESGCIRLNAKHFAQWKAAFVKLDLEAELLSLTPWADTQGSNWFCAVSGALAKRNREIGIRHSAAQQGKVLTAAGQPWPDGQM